MPSNVLILGLKDRLELGHQYSEPKGLRGLGFRLFRVWVYGSEIFAACRISESRLKAWGMGVRVQSARYGLKVPSWRVVAV